MVDFVKGLLRREAARVIAASGTIATAAALWAATQLGVELSEQFIAGVGVFAIIVTTELIRHFVWSEESVETVVKEAVEETA